MFACKTYIDTLSSFIPYLDVLMPQSHFERVGKSNLGD